MHSLSNINEESRTGICSICGLVRVKLRDKNKKKLNSKWRCSTPHRAANNRFSFPYRIHKKDFCEQCGFIPNHPCQLDVDHIDGNNKNNSMNNLQTLCANCHRLKTFLAKEGSYRFGIIKVPCPIDKNENSF
jgi:hypothetical protein